MMPLERVRELAAEGNAAGRSDSAAECRRGHETGSSNIGP